MPTQGLIESSLKEQILSEQHPYVAEEVEFLSRTLQIAALTVHFSCEAGALQSAP